MLRRIASLLACLALAVIGAFAPQPGFAQGDNVMNWRVGMPSQARPAAAPRQTYQPRRRTDIPRTPRWQDDHELGLVMPDIRLSIPLPPDEQRTKIALVGDSLAEALAFGFDADLGFKNEFLIRSTLSSSSGLVRDDYHDWPKALAALIAEHRDITAIIIMIGLNDRQALRIGAETLEPLSEPWRAVYRQRIDQLMAAARVANVPILWVGMPVMRLPKLSADLMQLNEMIRDRVQVAGGTYVDIVDAFADGNGGFSPTGPDVIGDIVRLRGPDGIHFTPAGQRKLAFFVERPLRRALGDRQPLTPMTVQPSPRPLLALPQILPEGDVMAVPAAPSFSTPGLGDLAIPVPTIDSALVALPQPRPAIGQMLMLNEVRAANRLLTREAVRNGDIPSRERFDRGLPPPPRAGRSDDYGWR